MDSETNRSRSRRWAVAAGCLVAGLLTFVAVTIVLTAVLDPLIWPSLLVSLPLGFAVGSAVAAVGYYYASRGPESGIDRRTIGIVAFFLVFGLLVGGLYALGQQRLDESYESTYEYRVTLSADQTLENATVYVPVPLEDGQSRLGEQFVESARYERHTPSVRGYDGEPAPVNFTYDVVETEHGPMLSISADRIEVSTVYYRTVENETTGWNERISPDAYDPDDPSMGVQNDGSFTFTVTTASAGRIDTADPFAGEPMLSRSYDRSEVECTFATGSRHRCYEYDGRVYADYDTANDTAVYLSSELSGRNEWFSGGWTGNEYREWIRVELRGRQEGWYLAEGETEVGSGNYRE
ncbi:MFS transporter [Halomicroarcula limicola]|uniref:MFS transporter n=1 Tax=Haloarcula limicola TaxID=1429915 RepID=A0A8J7YCU6_9EURY|nr:MFS transporter [Halomicroarcula limicola]MBV0925914.1 MFS transporter [Halomicroarcula limicola]